MKIVVIGATGATGRRLLEQAAAAGDQVVAYTRHPEAVAGHDSLDVAGGHLEDQRALVATLQGADAVLMAIGPKRMSNVTLMRRVTPHLVSAMKQAGVKRLVVLSAMGVGESARAGSPMAKGLYRTVLRSVYADKVVAERSLDDPELQVTRVLPVMLTDGPNDPDADVRPLDEVHRVKGTPRVSRGTVARVMLGALRDPSTIGRSLVVSARGSIS